MPKFYDGKSGKGALPKEVSMKDYPKVRFPGSRGGYPDSLERVDGIGSQNVSKLGSQKVKY